MATIIEPMTDSIIDRVEAEPSKVFERPAMLTDLLGEIDRTIASVEPDLSTVKGRKEIASRAHRVTKIKTAIDAAGKERNEEARRQINVVDEVRRKVRDQLDAMRDRIRKPLDDWEAQEQARVDSCRAIIDRLTHAAVVTIDDTSKTITARLAEVRSVEITESDFQEWYASARSKRDAAVQALDSALVRIAREEQERAELERLRAEAAERERLERERAEAERKAKEEAERRAAAEAAEKERIARAAQEAEARARAEAEGKARKEREDAERKHREELESLRREKEEAERRERAQAEQARRQEEARKAEEARIAAEDARRLADQEHRSNVMRAAKEALMEHAGLGEAAAKKVVLAISGGSIPHISIRF